MLPHGQSRQRTYNSNQSRKSGLNNFLELLTPGQGVFPNVIMYEDTTPLDNDGAARFLTELRNSLSDGLTASTTQLTGYQKSAMETRNSIESRRYRIGSTEYTTTESHYIKFGGA